MNQPSPFVTKIFIYPIKSLDGVAVQHATLLSQAGLRGDREFAIVDEAGEFVNGKRTAKIHRIRSQFDLEARTVSLSLQETKTPETFHLDTDRPSLERWLSDYFQMSVHLIQNQNTGFPDDTISPGPTVVSTATLEAIASWYPDLTVEETRAQFRSNIEISGVPAFWEDQLFAATDDGVEFQIGSARLIGVNPCQRCIVVTRNPQTGEPLPQFQKVFIARRKETLPDWVERSRFNHFYRLAINTRAVPFEAATVIQVGDLLF